MQMFWTFSLSFDEDNLAFFVFATVLDTFSKIWAIFYQSSGHPTSNGHTCLYPGRTVVEYATYCLSRV